MNYVKPRKKFRVIPRSQKHLYVVMTGLGYEVDEDREPPLIDVYMPGGLIEEANIFHPNYIMLMSDSCKYYYAPKTGDRKAKDLKIILRKHCTGTGVVEYNEMKYCEECYKKIKNVPRISVLKSDMQ